MGISADHLPQNKNQPKLPISKGKPKTNPNHSSYVAQAKYQETADSSPQIQNMMQHQQLADSFVSHQYAPIQKKENNTGLPDPLKSGIENLSGYSMDDVKVHYNSAKPAQLQAHAFAQGTHIHISPGQEKHLPHETWHVVQQKQGRVKPTMQMKSEVSINDDVGLEKEADMMGAQATQTKAPEKALIKSHPIHSNSSPVVSQLVKKKEDGWYTDKNVGPFNEQEQAEYAERNPGMEITPQKYELINRWYRFDKGKIPEVKKGRYHDLGFEKGITFGGGNNGMWVQDLVDDKQYFIKGYATEHMLENHMKIIGERKSEKDEVKDDRSQEKKILLPDLLNDQPEEKPSFDTMLKQAIKNKKAIYEYIAISAYEKAGLKPPFSAHLFQDEQQRVFLANDWTTGVKSVLPPDMDEIPKDEGNKYPRWEKTKPEIQNSKAFRHGLAMDLVLGMHDMLNVDNWKTVKGKVKPFDFGGPFDARATSQEIKEDGKQGKEGWAIPDNINAIGRWLNDATLSMLNFGDSSDKMKQKSVYAKVSSDMLKESAEFMSGKWGGLIQYIKEELEAKGVHPEEIKELVKILTIRAKTMQLVAEGKLDRDEYISWDPKESLSGKFKGLEADPKGRIARIKSGEKQGPLVATAPKEKIEGGGILHTGLIESENYYGNFCVRVYQTSFAPLNERTLTGKFKDVYQEPLMKRIIIEPNRKKSGEVAATCYNIGRPLRALKWAEKYLTQNGMAVDAQPVVRSFLIPYKVYMQLLDHGIQHESKYEPKQGMLQNVDSSSAPEQYEFTESQIKVLQEHALAGSLQTYTINAVDELPKSEKIDHGTSLPMRALYDKVGVPVFADTLSNKFHPWITKTDHMNQKGGSSNRREFKKISESMELLKSDKLKFNDKEEEKDMGFEKEDPIKKASETLKAFLLEHLGPHSRYLQGIAREMIHQEDIDPKSLDGPLLLSKESYITPSDQSTILNNNMAQFFMGHIVGSAMTQLEILHEYGDWTEVLDREAMDKKDSKDSGVEAYSYGQSEISPHDFGDRKNMHFSSPKSWISIREKMHDMYTLHQYDIRILPKRHLNIIKVLQDAGILPEDLPKHTKKLIKGLTSSDNISELLNQGMLSKEDLMDLLMSAGIYGDAWMSGFHDEDPKDIGLSSKRRSEGHAEYLNSDLEGFAKTRAKEESKPESVVRRELNAELATIPKLENFTDKNIRISPKNANINKHRSDITPITKLGLALSKIIPEKEEKEDSELGYQQLLAIKSSLEMLKSILVNKTLKHSAKKPNESDEINLWKIITSEMTRHFENIHLMKARQFMQKFLEGVKTINDLDTQIQQLDQRIDKLKDDEPLYISW